MGGNSPIGRKIPGKLNVEKELTTASVMMRNLVKLVHSVAEKLLVMGNFTYSIPFLHLHRDARPSIPSIPRGYGWYNFLSHWEKQITAIYMYSGLF